MTAHTGTRFKGGVSPIFFNKSKDRIGHFRHFVLSQIFPLPWNRLSCCHATWRKAQAYRTQENRQHVATRPRAPVGPEPLAPGLIQGPPAHFSVRQREIWTETLANATRQLWRKADGSHGGRDHICRWPLAAGDGECSCYAEIDWRATCGLCSIVGHRNVIMPSPCLRVIRLAAAEMPRSPASGSLRAPRHEPFRPLEPIGRRNPRRAGPRLDPLRCALLQKAANRS